MHDVSGEQFALQRGEWISMKYIWSCYQLASWVPYVSPIQKL